ncbi:hypothetical protein ACGC1H_005846 [Rhizoctonia solani]
MTVITQLNVAYNLLRASIDQYLAVCSSINQANAYGSLPDTVLPELVKCVSDELVRVRDLGQTLLTARAVLAATRNHVSFIVPISRLPDDILIHIFQLVTTEHIGRSHDIDGKISHRSLGYPMLLTRVCSRWRRVAMGSTRLWLHIDMPSYVSCDEVAVARVKERINRAGKCPLDLHMVEPDIDSHPAPTLASLVPVSQLLAPISHRIRSLDCKLGKPIRTLQCPESNARRYSLVLSTFLGHTAVGALERLAINLENVFPGYTSQHYFMEASESSQSPGTLRVPTGNIVFVSTPPDELESLLFSVSNLELKGLYPRWTSKAYHGLVELRLGAFNGVSIPETDLRAILSSSPKLRHLDVGLKITRLSRDLDDSPVLLEELETLVIGQRGLEELGSFLRFIRPGSRPLSIYLDKSGKCSSYPDIPRVPFDARIQAFFARANVETLGIAGTYNYAQVAELLGLVPRVHVLVLNGLCLGNVQVNACAAWSNAGVCLGDVYLVRETTVASHFLVWLIGAYHVRRVLLAEDSKVTRTDCSSVVSFLDEASRLGCSLESISSTESYPMQLWD